MGWVGLVDRLIEEPICVTHPMVKMIVRARISDFICYYVRFDFK